MKEVHWCLKKREMFNMEHLRAWQNVGIQGYVLVYVLSLACRSERKLPEGLATATNTNMRT